jgi:hypothetical protein
MRLLRLRLLYQGHDRARLRRSVDLKMMGRWKYQTQMLKEKLRSRKTTISRLHYSCKKKKRHNSEKQSNDEEENRNSPNSS